MKPGVRVRSVEEGSPGFIAGVRTGDLILSVDGRPVEDAIDLFFHAAEGSFEIEVERDGMTSLIEVRRTEGEGHGILPEDPLPAVCRNDCVFCFIKGLPDRSRVRPGLFVRDDDYRLSFLNGNFTTLTGLEERDIERIIEYNLSPLYVSVHSTDPEIRRRIFGRDTGIMPILGLLGREGVKFHLQMVIAEGLNDGPDFERSMDDLLSLGEAARTIGVVPVGLTRWMRTWMRDWRPDGAGRFLERILHAGDGLENGRVQAADEWFILAGEEPPPADYYASFEQYENGIGIVRRFLDEWKTERESLSSAPDTGGLVITGRAAAPILAKAVEELNRRTGADMNILAVENLLFGESVTVAGLLDWESIREGLASIGEERRIVIPDVMLDGEGRFISGVTLEEARMEYPGRIIVAETSARGLAACPAPPPAGYHAGGTAGREEGIGRFGAVPSKADEGG